MKTNLQNVLRELDPTNFLNRSALTKYFLAVGYQSELSKKLCLGVSSILYPILRQFLVIM